MKTITCLDCAEEFAGETPEAVQSAMLPHYKEKHAEIINAVDESGKKEWLAEFNRRWDAA